jgi:UTP--glucose-1-phosphate uridylyltransferase
MRALRKAVLPVAGLGTRFLPATKAMAKEMLPVVDKPLIQYAIEEARAAGIEQFCMVTGRGKTALVEHFDVAFELEATLRERNKQAELRMLNEAQLPPGAMVAVRQQVPLGLGHAIWCARAFIGDDPFAILLPDDLVLADVPCTQQLIEHLARMERGAGNEVQLTDGMARMIGNTPFHGLRYEGRRFDCGDKIGFLEAQIAFALRRPEMATAVRAFLKNYQESA